LSGHGRESRNGKAFADSQDTMVMKGTICKWVDLAGKHCEEVTDYFFKDLHLDRMQVDEIWSYIKSKKISQKTILKITETSIYQLQLKLISGCS
jgi:hypothetical protein